MKWAANSHKKNVYISCAAIIYNCMGGREKEKNPSSATAHSAKYRAGRLSAPPQIEGPADSWDRQRLAQQFLDVAEVMFVGIDANQNVRLINKKGLEILGCEQESEVLGKNWFDTFLPQHCSSQVRAVFEKLIRGEVDPVEYHENPVIAINGEEKYIAWHNTLRVDDQGNIVGTLSSGEDITELKEAQEVLAVQRDLDSFLSTTLSIEDALDKMLETAISISCFDCGGIYRTDDRGNLVLVKHMGLSRAFIEKTSIFPADSPNARLVHEGKAIYKTHKKLGLALSEEKEQESLKAIAVIPIRHQGAVIACLNLASHEQDDIPSKCSVFLEGLANRVGSVIARLKATEATIISEGKYRELAQSLPQTIFEINMEGRITFANSHGFNTFGYAEEDLERGISVLDVIVRQDHERLQMNMKRIFTGEEVSGNEYTAIRKDGHRFPIVIYPTPIMKDEKVAGIRGVIIDLTERKQLEAEREARAQMEGVEKLASGVAHDFNNLLMGIMSSFSVSMSWLKEECKELPYSMMKTRLEQTLEVLEEGEDASQRAIALAKRLLMISRRTPSAKTEASISGILRGASMFLRSSPIKEEYDLPENLYRVRLDPNQISRVVQNIVINATEAMPSGGMLKLSANNVHLRSNEVHGLKAGSYVKVCIQDNGPGMSPDIASRIFERFYTTKERGTGLGLYNCRSIIEEHKGHIDVESKEGEGTLFYFYLPTSIK